MDPLQTETSGAWTNEKHLHYLNSMEAAFVRTMLENNSWNLRLDRHMPDSSESTLDLISQRPKKHSTASEKDEYYRRRRNGMTNKNHNDSSSQDQVVPQLEKRSGAERDGPIPTPPQPLCSGSGSSSSC